MGLRDMLNTDIVVVRSRITAERYTARESHFSSRATPRLHYTDATRLFACRCAHHETHEYAPAVRNGSVSLARAIAAYLDRFGLETCSVSSVYRFHEQQTIGWTVEGVQAERFHYLDGEKDVVCQCERREHRACRRVRNLEVRERCAGYFVREREEVECSRAQWRAVVEQTSVSKMGSLGPRMDSLELQQESSRLMRSYPTKKTDSSEFNVAQVVGFSKSRKPPRVCEPSQIHRPQVSSNISTRSPKRNPLYLPLDLNYVHSALNNEADVPGHVWQAGRPSVYREQHCTESVASTPLGSAVSAVSQSSLPYSQAPVPAVRKVSSASAGNGHAHSSGSSRLYHTSEVRGDSRAAPSADIDYTGLEVSSDEALHLSTASSALPTRYVSPRLAELPAPMLAAELQATPMYSPTSTHYLHTLVELDGRSSVQVTELASSQTSISSNSPSKREPSSRRITRLVERPLFEETLPTQKDFLNQVKVLTRKNAAPTDNCYLCQNAYNAPDQVVLELSCGHLTHRVCLISDFRSQDSEFGNCPVCDMVLCKRTLGDQIETDRKAIFGLFCTDLRAKVCVKLPHRGETVVCRSEEEVTAVQLRVLKDFINVRADEVYRQWLQTPWEPDWYNAVIWPIVQSFRGWSMSERKSKYFADHHAFFELVVWAELTRLMNVTHDAVKRAKGDNVSFPQLSGLHGEFVLAKGVYEANKRTWLEERPGKLEFDRVAQDAFSIAVSTRLGRRE